MSDDESSEYTYSIERDGGDVTDAAPRTRKRAVPKTRKREVAVAEVDVIRWPDTSDPVFMERMREARRERGLVGLIEELRRECALRPGEVPRGWVERAVVASQGGDGLGGDGDSGDESDGMAR